MLKEAFAFSSMWANQVVKPLRSARTWMKDNPAIAGVGSSGGESDQEMIEGFNVLREQIKTLELQSERFQENMLESLAKAPVQELNIEIQIAAALYNLRYIVEASSAPVNITLANSLATLLLNTLDDEPDDPLIHRAIVTEFTTCEFPPSA